MKHFLFIMRIFFYLKHILLFCIFIPTSFLACDILDSGNDESIIPVENVNLSALEVSEGSLSPVFDQETVYYSLESEEPLSSITITPASVFEGTSITINDSPVASGETSAPISLDSGLNIIVIKTCSQSGNSSRIYVLAVYGPDIPDDNRNLWGVIITGGG